MFVDAQAWSEIARALHLSQRELEIVQGVFDDRTEATIATDLGISPHTVHTHLNRLHRKLEVVDRVQLVTRIVSEFLALTALKQSMRPICAYYASDCCPVRCR